MVSKRFSYISKIWGFLSGVFLVLIYLFTDEIKKWITSACGVSSETFVFYAMIAILASGIISSIMIFVWDFKIHKKTQLDSRFIHLTIHYSDRRDSPDTRNPHRPRFVVNGTTKQAFPVSDLIEPYIKKHNIQWNTHDNEKALRTYFKKAGIKLNDDILNPRPEDLGLSLSRRNYLIPLNQETIALLSKLKGTRNEDLRIWIVLPWYCYLLPFLERLHPPTIRLLIRYSTLEVFEAPLYDQYLIDNDMVDSQRYKNMRPWESVNTWVKRKHPNYTFRSKRFSDKDLEKGV